MPRRPKTVEQYEAEAIRDGECMLTPHPSNHTARRIYQRRHGVTLRPDQLVCHTCDKPRCINDDHHFIGTSQDNVLDSVRKKRHSCFAPPNGRGMVGPHSEETKRKIGESSKRMWERRREAIS